MSDSTISSSTTSGIRLRITGMASGLDIDSMVKSMMDAEQVKLDKVKQQQQLIKWKQEAYQDIIKDVKDLQSSFFDVTKTDNVLSSNNWVNISGTSSDDTVASVTAKTGAAIGNYEVDVTSIAKSAIKTGDDTVNTQFTISKVGGVTNVDGWKGGTINFDINGEVGTSVDLTNFTGTNAVQLVSYINGQITADPDLNGKLSVSLVRDENNNDIVKFTPLNGASIEMLSDISDIDTVLGGSSKKITSASLSTKLTDLNSTLTGSYTLNLNYNGTDVEVSLDNTDGDKTISDLATAIDTATGGQVKAKFDDTTGKFTLETTSTGSVSTLQITGGNATLLSALKLSTDATAHQGTDANLKITLGGTETTLTQTTNNFTVNNISYSLSGTGHTDVSVASDTEKVYDKIKGFLEKYNTIIDKIQTKLSEKKSYDYPPLTDAQEDAMSDKEIENWNTEAKKGILRNDHNLENLLNNLRKAFTSPLKDSSGDSTTSVFFGNVGTGSIGIDTVSDASSGGKIYIVDVNKLKDAIANHGDQIVKLFTNTSTIDITDITTTATDRKNYFNESGIFQRMKDILEDNVGMTGTTLNSAILTKYANFQDDYSISGISGNNTLPDQIYYKQQLITKMARDLSDKQEHYYQQFSKLEAAMNQLNSQQAQLSKLGG